MSWIFTLFLMIYGLVRVVLWVRGQIRYRLIKDQIPGPGIPRPPPERLLPALSPFFEATDELRVDLANDLRMISIALITDPDVPIGHVRDGRVRWALLDANMHMRKWRRAVRLREDDSVELRHHYDDFDLSCLPIDHCAQRIRRVWWQAVRARRGEPFLVVDVETAASALARAVSDLGRMQDRLSRGKSHPYRGTLSAPTPATSQPAG